MFLFLIFSNIYSFIYMFIYLLRIFTVRSVFNLNNIYLSNHFTILFVNCIYLAKMKRITKPNSLESQMQSSFEFPSSKLNEKPSAKWKRKPDLGQISHDSNPSVNCSTLTNRRLTLQIPTRKLTLSLPVCAVYTGLLN